MPSVDVGASTVGWPMRVVEQDLTGGSIRVAVAYARRLGASRIERIGMHQRNPKWKNAPVRIEMMECINCDACLRHCPPHFGAIFNHGPDVVIIPELCSGLRQVPARLPGELHLPVPRLGDRRRPRRLVGRAAQRRRPVRLIG